jgi:hypothetical protein
MKRKKRKNGWKKYAYSIDTVKIGDKIPVFCDHKGCHRYLVMVVGNNSTMQCKHISSGTHFDMRNQSWRCHQHKIKNL